MSNSSLVQFRKLNKSAKGNMAQRLGIPLQKKTLKRPFTGVGGQSQLSRNKVTLFDARQKLLKKKPMDARSRLLVKKRLTEAIGISGVQDARLKLQEKQKIKTKALESNKHKSQILQQNQLSLPSQNYVSQEVLYQQPFQYQQPLIIPQQQQPMFQQQQQQQQMYAPGIYNVSGTLLKTIQGQQNMIEYASQPSYLKNTQAKKKNIIRLKPITAPSIAPTSTQNIGTTIHETPTNFMSGGWANGGSSNATNSGWNIGVASKTDCQDNLQKISAHERIASNSGVNFSPIQSYKVVVSNLAPSVSYEDVEELFGSIGQIRRIRFTKPRIADIFFVDRAHAIASVNKYHNRELDGLPMSVVMAPNQPLLNHYSNIPEVKNLLNNKSKVTTIDISASIVHNALFKLPYTSGKEVKFTVRM